MGKRRRKPKTAADFKTEIVSLADLQPHPRNYRSHPDDQLEHLAESLGEHGFYKNVVVARDGTILAGHGIVETARKLGKRKIPVFRLDLEPDDPRAIKILIGDNEVSKLAHIDDRMLTEMLRGLSETDPEDGLRGSGFDSRQLAALVMVTRAVSEIRDFDAANEWTGMPEYDPAPVFRQVVLFRSSEDRAAFAEQHGLEQSKTNSLTWSAWWPPKERQDISSVRFEADGGGIDVDA